MLLFRSQNEFGEALDLVDFALEEYSDNLPLMSLKVHLEEKVHGGEAAILTAKGMGTKEYSFSKCEINLHIFAGMLEQWQSACEQIAAEESVVESAGSQLAPNSSNSGAANILLQHPLGGLVGSTAATMVGAAAHHQVNCCTKKEQNQERGVNFNYFSF